LKTLIGVVAGIGFALVAVGALLLLAELLLLPGLS